MKICPKCKNEYRKEILYCADCGCELVDEKEETQKKECLIEADYPFVKEAEAYLKYCNVNTVYMDEPDEEGMVRLYCDKKEEKEAKRQLQGFEQAKKQKEAEDKLADMTAEEVEKMVEEAQAEAANHVYQNSKDKAEDHKSSAVSFFVIGAIGLVLVILSWFELIPISIGGSGNWFSHGILFVFFVLFLVIGAVSAKNVKKYEQLATKEEQQQHTLQKYLQETCSKDVLEQITADSEEEAYFKRMNYMREQVAETFPELAENEAFVEALLDEHYDTFFG